MAITVLAKLANQFRCGKHCRGLDGSASATQPGPFKTGAIAPAAWRCSLRFADHTRRRLKLLICMTVAHAHAKTHVTNAMSRLEAKIKTHAARAQQTNARSFQPAPPGPGSARARAIGARTIARNPKIIRLSLNISPIREPPVVKGGHLNGDILQQG